MNGEHGYASSPPAPTATNAYWMPDSIRVTLDSGRVIRVPFGFATDLHTASDLHRRGVRVVDSGAAIAWPSLGLTLPIFDLLRDSLTVVDPGPGETLPLDVTHREEDDS